MPPNIAPDPLLTAHHHQHLLDLHEDGVAQGQGEGQAHAHRTAPLARNGLTATTDLWMEERRAEDGAEGLWRVGDKLYDLTSFTNRHPGGADWITMTKGTDITEVFYSYHIGTAPEEILPKYLVRRAVSPRAYPYTFHRDGFYMQLRSRVRDILASTPKKVREAAQRRSENIIDCLVLSTLAACFLAAYFQSYVIGTVAGLLLSATASCAHNFFHQRHTWRRYYFDMSFMSSREWMVSHVLSHHMYPNTTKDLEITFLEPFLYFLPDPKKNFVSRFVSWIYSPFFYAFMAHGQFAKRLGHLQWCDAVALVVPFSMLLSGASLCNTWLMWTWVLLVSSLYFAFQGLSAGHHHPDNFHDGDAVREDRDFGLMQLDTTSYCSGLRGRESLLMVLTHFGDHRLHHLFPSLDHALLPILEPGLVDVLKQFGVPNATASSWEMVRGKYMQLARNKPNPLPPGHQQQ